MEGGGLCEGAAENTTVGKWCEGGRGHCCEGGVWSEKGHRTLPLGKGGVRMWRGVENTAVKESGGVWCEVRKRTLLWRGLRTLVSVYETVKKCNCFILRHSQRSSFSSGCQFMKLCRLLLLWRSEVIYKINFLLPPQFPRDYLFTPRFSTSELVNRGGWIPTQIASEVLRSQLHKLTVRILSVRRSSVGEHVQTRSPRLSLFHKPFMDCNQWRSSGSPLFTAS